MKFKALLYSEPIGYTASVLFAVLSVVMYNKDKTAFILSVAAFAAFLIAAVVRSVYKTRSAERFIIEINKSLKLKHSDYADGFPLPGLLVDENGRILTFNKAFEDEIISGDAFSKHSIREFFGGSFSFDGLSEKQCEKASFNGREYTAFISKTTYNQTPVLSVYFYDDTYFKQTEQEYIRSRPFVMYVTVDNIDILSRRLSDSKFALVTSGIESKIENWLSKYNVIIKKLSNGKFIIIGEQHTLDDLCTEKFSVLSDVREYKFNNTPVDATLSLGIGCANDLSLCEERAKKALDMSLGRGGDQAAVLNDTGYTYFGGIINMMHDNSKVSPRRTAADILNVIRKYDNVLIMGHRFSDNDCVGASLGMLFLASALGKAVRIAVDSQTTLAEGLLSFAGEKGHDFFVEPAEALRLCDDKTLLIITDTHRAKLTECPELCKMAASVIVIDHHRRMEDYISDAEIFYHNPSSSSACEMVAELIEYAAIGENLPPVIATAVLSGIVLDTRDYVLRTSQRTFEAAAFLKRSGADTVAVKKLFAVTENQINLKNKIISNGFLYRTCMISASDIADKNIRIISSKAADEMLNIAGVAASFVITLMPGGVYISARSLGEINVQVIMEKLGGGGHSTMAATQLRNIGLESAIDQLEAAADAYYSSL